MKLTRKQLKKIILKEMIDPVYIDIAKTVASLVAVFGSIHVLLMNAFLDAYVKGMYSPEDLKRIENSPDPVSENEKVLAEKGYKMSDRPLGLPRK